MTRASGTAVSVLCMVLQSAALAGEGPPPDLDPVTGFRHAVRWVGDEMQEYRLERDGLAIVARMDVGLHRRIFALRGSRAGEEPPARLTPAERADLERLGGALADAEWGPENGFLRVLNLLASWPPGLPLRASMRDGVVTTALGTWTVPEPEDRRDICGKMNQSHSGGYPVFGFWRSFDDLGIVGPHPYDQGDCLGRCGAGCPGDGPPNNSVYAFGQDCFNHDACVRDQGLTDLDCDLIFPAAFDDFLYGPSCQKDNIDIVINGQDVPLLITLEEEIEIRVSLMNVPAGRPVDYWLYAETSVGTFWLDLDVGWIQGGPPVPAQQGSLREVADYLVYQGPLPPGFPAGLSTFYASADLSQDGSFSGPRQFEDAIEVTVSEAN